MPGGRRDRGQAALWAYVCLAALVLIGPTAALIHMETTTIQTTLDDRLKGIPFDGDHLIWVRRHGAEATVSLIVDAGRAYQGPTYSRYGSSPAVPARTGRDLTIRTTSARVVIKEDAEHGIPWLESTEDGEPITTSSLGARTALTLDGVTLHLPNRDELRITGD